MTPEVTADKRDSVDLPSTNVIPDKLAHLTAEQRQQLLALSG